MTICRVYAPFLTFPQGERDLGPTARWIVPSAEVRSFPSLTRLHEKTLRSTGGRRRLGEVIR